MAKEKAKNTIVETYEYKGFSFDIPRYPRVILRVDQNTFKDIIRARVDTDLSDRQILGYSSCPCEHCKGTVVTAITKSKKTIEVKRGILSKFIPKK